MARPELEAEEMGEEEEEEERSSSESVWLLGGGGDGVGRERAERLFVQRHRQLAAECLAAHNTCRALHGAPPLLLSKKLCRHSKAWAYYLAQIGQMESRYHSPFGENLFLVWPTRADYVVKGSEPVDHWYSGIRDYAFGCEPRNLLCLHFTQMVWRATQRLGVGVARAADGKVFVVANYAPRGNLMGHFVYQVSPAGGFSEDGAAAVEELACAGKPPSAPQQEGLHLHNELRRRHNVPLLSFSPTLCLRAKAWARQLADEDRHAYMVDNPLGENVFSFVSSDAHTRQRVGVRNALDAWYVEGRLFDYGNEPLDTKAPRAYWGWRWRAAAAAVSSSSPTTTRAATSWGSTATTCYRPSPTRPPPPPPPPSPPPSPPPRTTPPPTTMTTTTTAATLDAWAVETGWRGSVR